MKCNIFSFGSLRVYRSSINRSVCVSCCYCCCFVAQRHAQEIPRDKHRVRQGVLWTRFAVNCAVDVAVAVDFSVVECHTVDSVKLAIFMALPVATDLLNGCSTRTSLFPLSLSLSGVSPKMGSCETFKI